MPQLDIVSYFYQFNWLLLTFFVFYIFLLKNFLPAVAKALKTRTKKLIKDKNDVFNIEEKEKQALLSYEKTWDSLLKVKNKQLKILNVSQLRNTISLMSK